MDPPNELPGPTQRLSLPMPHLDLIRDAHTPPSGVGPSVTMGMIGGPPILQNNISAGSTPSNSSYTTVQTGSSQQHFVPMQPRLAHRGPVVPVSSADRRHTFHPALASPDASLIQRSASSPSLQSHLNGEKRPHGVPDGRLRPPKRQRSIAPGDAHPALTFMPDSPANSLTAVTHQEIDLTIDKEEEEVTFLGKPQEEEVCYGTIQDIIVHARRIATPPPGARSLDEARKTPAIRVNLRRLDDLQCKEITVLDCTRAEIGKIEEKFATIMTQFFLSKAPFRMSGRIPSEPKQHGQEPGQMTSRIYKIQVTVFGPRKWGSVLGRRLLENQFILGAPSMLERGIKYENPQTAMALKNAQQQNTRPQVGPKAMSTNLSNSIHHNTLLTTGAYPLTQPQISWPISDHIHVDVQKEVKNLFDKISQRIDLPLAAQPELVRTPLLDHQKQGLHFMQTREKPIDYDAVDNEWMVHRWQDVANNKWLYRNVITGMVQKDRPRQMLGGLLADEMGLGKTLSILSLCTSSIKDAADWASSAPVEQHLRPEPRTKQGSGNPRHELTRIDINTKGTLLVCPLSTIQNWEEQIQTHIDPRFKTYTYHGPNRIKDIHKLADFDLILTTYSTAASDLIFYVKNGTVKPPLERIGWFRVALDEAHSIRQATTTNFKAMVRLKASRRWAITGTPIQNRLEDLGSLLSFLRLEPFYDATVFNATILSPFKNADPSVLPKLRILVDSITIRRKKNLITLPKKHDMVVELEFTPVERRDYDIFARDAQSQAAVVTQHSIGLKGRTYMTILMAISRLRKMCAFGAAGLNEDDLKLLVGRSAEEPIDIDSDDDGESKNLTMTQAYEHLQLLRESDSDVCRGCDRRIGTGGGEEDGAILCFITSCMALICPACIEQYLTAFSMQGCQFCIAGMGCRRIELKKTEVDDPKETDSSVSAQNGNSSRKRHKKIAPLGSIPHTKTLQLVRDLEKSEEWSTEHPEEEPEKSIVFSAWTTHLDLIEPHLQAAGIKFTRLDGTMNLKQRTNAINTFREDRSVHVILVSIYAGGLGLNLTAGSRVYVMEPQWNPQVEAQAVDRVHRLGQMREVHIIRYIMKDSFEFKVQKVQKKKQQLAELSMDKTTSKEDAAKKRLEDIRDLFK